MGTRQSGILDLQLSDLSKDGAILQLAREEAIKLVKKDPGFNEHSKLKSLISKPNQGAITWSDVS